MTTKFSQITQATTNISSGDFLIGVQGGVIDTLFSFSEIKQGIDPELISGVNTDWYVVSSAQSSGSDSNNGRLGTPFATIQHAFDVIAGYELNGIFASINLSSGTYPGFIVDKPNPSGSILLVGSSSNSSNYIITPLTSGSINACINIDNDINLSTRFVTLDGTGVSSAYGIRNGAAHSDATYYGLKFVNCANPFAAVAPNINNIFGDMSFTGNSVNGIKVQDEALVIKQSDTITINSTPAYSGAFIDVDTGGIYKNAGTVTVSGGATGRRFNVETTGNIQTGTNSLTYFPGDAAGTVQPGGLYDDYPGPSPVSQSGLPATPKLGMIWTVTDSSGVVWGGVYGGAGARTALIWYNGTNWIVIGT